MASEDKDTPTAAENIETQPETAIEKVAEAVAKISLQDAESPDTSNTKTDDNCPPPLRVYTRSEALLLYRSPLVSPPDGMPVLKDWFGDWTEQIANKKDAEISNTPANSRDRRFRRDPEDGDASTRPTFRTIVTQPSQMGNFRHQSIRTGDRGGDKDSDRERERDLRDKEGQERLRNLSDKYDRERLALSSATSNLRTKERDTAPHLSTSPSTRLGQTQGTARREGRDAPKRKIGESSEDWRRGAEPARAGRDDRGDNSRRDRDNRERPRSRVRESSKSRRDTSPTRRDREDRDRPRERRGEGDRDDHRKDKDKDDHSRRDRDDYFRRDREDYDRDRDDNYRGDVRDRYDYSRRPRDLEWEDEDQRRWRDDGRRDERMAARRGWDRYDDRDRERPTAPEDRETRAKRGTGRDRKVGGGNDEGKERDDRRERDKEKEAEPAWMETYVPTTPGAGILGGQSTDGELDGIQAWKKGMKEKERKEKEAESGSVAAKTTELNGSAKSPPSTNPPSAHPESQLDEIQLFKLMMKREAEKKEVEKPQNGVADHPLPSEPSPPRGLSSPSVQERPKLVPAGNETNGNSTHISEELPARSTIHQEHPRNSPKLPADGSQSLLSVLNTAPNEIPPSSGFANLTSSSSDYPLEKSRVVGSRVIPNLAPSKMSPITPSESSPIDLSTTHTPAPPAFNPPPGSRLLAFGTRAPTAGQNTSNLPPGKGFMSADPTIAQLSPPGLSIPNPSRLTATMSGIVPQLQDAAMADSQFGSNTRLHPSESSRASRDFSPLGHPNQTTLPFDDLRESASLGPMNDAIRRAQGATAAERFALANDTASLYGELGSSGVAFGSTGVFDSSGSHPPGAANYAASKGSRFAKFFDLKTREAQTVGQRIGQPMPGLVQTSSHVGPRQDTIFLNGMATPKAEGRTMDDIFAMLQSSTQHNRLSPQIPQSSRMQIGGGAYGQGHSELQILQQQHLQAQQFVQNNRMDSLYDSRLDDRNFVPDGLVPGLRPAPPRSRSRESSNVLYADQLDDPLHFNVQRLTQQRNLEQMYSGPVPSMYAQQTGMMRNGGMPIQQFRGASPISSQHPLQGPSQRLPPGLANLGGRPPHDPSQYLGSGVGMGGGLHGGIHGSTPAQQVYNNFTAGGLGFGGNPQARGPPGPQNPLSVNAMAGLGPGNVDLRNASHAQLLSMGGANHMGGGMRGSGPGFGPQHGPAGQLPATHVTMRQQQHLPPHMMPQLLPPHLQQQQGLQGGTAQGTQDLMALLMGGHRE